MTRIENIFLKVRDTLADQEGTRWSTPRLLRLLNEAQNDIVIRAKVLRDKVTLPVYTNQSMYTLPDNVFLLDRALLNNSKLEFIDHTKLDIQQGDWETEEGITTHLVFDKMNRRQIKLYPIPKELTQNKYLVSADKYKDNIYYEVDTYGILTTPVTGDILTSVYGIVSDVDFIDYVLTTLPCTCDGIQVFDSELTSDYGELDSVTTVLKELVAQDPNYGIVTSISGYSPDNNYGIVTGLNDEFTMYSIYGVTTSIYNVEDYLTVYFCKKPDTIDSIYDDLEIDSMFDSAIKYYITGKALRDDMDTQNRTVGSEELAFYDRELKEIISNDSLDFTRNDNNQFYTNYYGGI